jgi:hypothetical protein
MKIRFYWLKLFLVLLSVSSLAYRTGYRKAMKSKEGWAQACPCTEIEVGTYRCVYEENGIQFDVRREEQEYRIKETQK